MMRVIATGKGGAGKTTIVSTLSCLLARDGYKVIVFDTDPSMNLAMSLGVPFQSIRTLAEDKASINEAIDEDGHKVDAELVIKEHSCLTDDGVRVVIMGTIPSGGAGCLCSPIALVKVLLESLGHFPDRYDFVIVDSQAGPEILGRGLAASFDCNLVVTEATPKAMEVTRQVMRLSQDLWIRYTLLVLNKYEGERDMALVEAGLGMGPRETMTVRYDCAVWEADRGSTSVLDEAPGSGAVADIQRIGEMLLALKG